VIFAAKPGTFARPRPNPDVSWDVVGPLAARLTIYQRQATFDAQPPSLFDLVANVTEFKGTGELEPAGSIGSAVMETGTCSRSPRRPWW